eukprot:CAMPEP_0198335972 /NCGR_PEP_ID=MMETSP1450-20131203/20675_1 /TAXON_ID=753684 ORGANISM="Madagascaria erythrocladiodes, Strain CCMP3234" /NCGR_SAMPLE_ID=MMETSP1450 /ASSEMBLY_ACC=CAM_ASM_001115 /LENGTH=176 /DNA_ID=CAMNT_0044040669 /DNA_START=170 /DNA_END=697 /DNA_ORIENTATION=-
MTNTLFVLVTLVSLCCLQSVIACNGMDTMCWSMKSVNYLNGFRRANGIGKMLRAGYKSQQFNADAHSRAMMGRRALYHQNLGSATSQIGCGVFVNAENVAYNYEKGDIARACMNQWQKSAPHRANLLNMNSDRVTVGFSRSSDGRVYCTMVMTMEMSSPPSVDRCKPIGGGGGGGG